MPTKNDYHWTFADHCHIEFQNGGTPVIVGNHAFATSEGCATMSDSNGGLLFYTDGTALYDGANAVVPSAPLGGNPSSTHSAIIVPPAGGGSRYHIFATHDWDSSAIRVGPISHSTVSVTSGVAVSSGPTQLSFGPIFASEQLAAIPHRDCGKYWVVSIGLPSKVSPGAGSLYAMLVDSDASPSAMATVVTPYPHPTYPGYCVKFSPDGSLFAVASGATIDILNFDRATGIFTPHSQVTGVSGTRQGYGIEFSPNGKYVYFSQLRAGNVYRHTIAAGTQPLSATNLIGTVPGSAGANYRLGALQLAPNRKIYGVKTGQTTLLEIGDPDNAAPASVQFLVDATTVGGGTLVLHKPAYLGLPTFTRITPECADRCGELAREIDRELEEARGGMYNQMRPCKGEQIDRPRCQPLDLPRIQPWTSISWGNSRCDCIEGDDTEIMYLTVCNPYSNLTLSNLSVQQLVVVDAAGNPVPNLPDGTPSIQLVPVGPYCFDDIPPCSCVSREFVLRLRGAPYGQYRILVRGICFDVCIHSDGDACFVFDVCKD